MSKLLIYSIGLVFLIAITSPVRAACFGGGCDAGSQYSDGSDMTPSDGSMGGSYSTPYQGPQNPNQMPDQYQAPNNQSPNQPTPNQYQNPNYQQNPNMNPGQTPGYTAPNQNPNYQNPNSNQMPNQYQNPNANSNQQNPSQQTSGQGSILSVANDNNATLFSQLMQQTGMDQQLASGGPYTIFVPTDAAVKAVPQNILQKVVESKDAADKTLNNMIVKGDISETGNEQSFQNLNGTTITMKKSGQDYIVNGQKIIGGSQKFANGTVYFIDGTILPQQFMQ